MSQVWDIDLISPTGTSPSADIQRIIDGFATVRSSWSGATEPVSADRVAYMLWADTTSGLLKIRNAANSAWVIVGTMAVQNMGNLCSFSQSKSGNYTVLASDRGSLIACTGTFTLTFTAAATLGDSWSCIARNDGVGQITLDANSAELIDGALTISLGPGETAIVYCTGAALKSFNRVSVGGSAPNPIINGNMEIWQRGTSFAAAPTAQYGADRWKYSKSSAEVVTINRSTNVPTVAQSGVLFNYSLEVDITTADASIAAGDLSQIEQIIEGYNWRHFAQRQFTLSFWVMSTKTGIHCVAFQNGTDRGFVAEYTVNVTNTWEYKTVTVSASPSAGTWNYTNSVGLRVAFALAAGTTFHTTAGAWQSSGQAWATVNQVNVLDNVANFFRITGVKMELGSVATPIQFMPFEEELARCQRYYEKSFQYATTPAQNVGANSGELIWSAAHAGAVTTLSPRVEFKVPKRTTPAPFTFYNPDAATAQVRNRTDAADLSATTTFANSVGEKGFNVGPTGTASTAIGETLAVHWTAEAEL